MYGRKWEIGFGRPTDQVFYIKKALFGKLN